ncbi:hypothetical protein ABID39_001066 [Bartonella japonica]|uniref:Uncharacterized protein n=1 Tax=Bartonella japonica TaxID=357761 RepID=A0ABV2FP78_9HYPH
MKDSIYINGKVHFILWLLVNYNIFEKLEFRDVVVSHCRFISIGPFDGIKKENFPFTLDLKD